MNIWSFMGLASKNDIINLNKQFDDMKKNIDMNMSSVVENMRSINNEIKLEVKDIKDKNKQNYLSTKDMIQRVDNKTYDLNKKYQKHENDLNIVLKGMYDLMTEIRTNQDNINNIIHYNINTNTSVKKINKSINECEMQINNLNKQILNVQKMIKVVWVNDILDTLEDEMLEVK